MKSAHSGLEMETGVMCLCERETAYVCVNRSAGCKSLHTHKHTYYIRDVHYMYTCMCEDHGAYEAVLVSVWMSTPDMGCTACME